MQALNKPRAAAQSLVGISSFGIVAAPLGVHCGIVVESTSGCVKPLHADLHGLGNVALNNFVEQRDHAVEPCDHASSNPGRELWSNSYAKLRIPFRRLPRSSVRGVLM